MICARASACPCSDIVRRLTVPSVGCEAALRLIPLQIHDHFHFAHVRLRRDAGRYGLELPQFFGASHFAPRVWISRHRGRGTHSRFPDVPRFKRILLKTRKNSHFEPTPISFVTTSVSPFLLLPFSLSPPLPPVECLPIVVTNTQPWSMPARGQP